jgi:hypothetical protein
MAGLEQLGQSFTEILLRVGGFAAVVLTAWTAFKVLIAGGGAERALRSGIVTLLIAAIALAALANPGATWSLFAMLGGSIFSAVREAVQTAVAPPAV